ncbi:unnamed protein product [Medioppia subpectinata]|uniref:Uncharacterized protein n=1 Tax=Medioppia subpectinata TaxID=1979941 RepID=A0A7R9QH91_9ACAR|nr:unnamed protein product [Medioppia subpectinata]CAG2120618.1 unnamed protein product [Medioppia subpectinata]
MMSSISSRSHYVWPKPC